MRGDTTLIGHGAEFVSERREPGRRLLEAVSDALGEAGTREERFLLAVSGGIDSVCLAHVLSELSRRIGFELALGHVNHGLRVYSGPNLPLIPVEACHPFRLKAATHSGESCHP